MKLALKIPPPAQGLIFGILMWIIDKQIPGPQFDVSFTLPLAISIAIAGIVINIFSWREFSRASTTVNPIHPEKASQLVAGGIFGYSRNPMYVGLLLLLIGWAVWLGSLLNFVVIAVFVTYITIFQIKPEEEVLKTLFGESYEQYCSKVRRWI